MMVLIHICTQPQEHSQPLIFLCVLRTFLWRLILWLNQIHYGSDHFPIIKKMGVSLLYALPRWNLNRATWVQFAHSCKEKMTLDTIELYDEPIVLFYDILCNTAKSFMPRTTSNRRNAVSLGFTRNVKKQWKPESRIQQVFEQIWSQGIWVILR